MLIFKTFDDKKLRANLFSTINGKQKLNGGGIILSGHTDVVPASAKDWTLILMLQRKR